MLEQLFGSQTRTKLLYLFLENPETRFFVREITRAINERINSVRRELDNLTKFGLITSKEESQKKYYQADKGFVLFSELKTLIEKSKLLAQRLISAKVNKLDGLKYLVLTGQLVGEPTLPTDVLLVGTVPAEQLQKFVKELEKAYRLSVRYTYLTTKEFNLRKEMTDKFLYTVLNSPKIELVNRLNTN
ncbi:MAG: winged helix-turn-helix domain-containing protein [Patescibacteria group bacterium]|jgi:DNA-binding transcriptional ArsR family regulator